MIENIDNILENYEKDLENAKQGKCKKINWCTDFKDAFQKAYQETYKVKLDQIREKLIERGHKAFVEENTDQDIFYGFTFSLIPRHILSGPIDRFFPSSIKSSIAFKANEHTLTVDVETTIRPIIDKWENSKLDKFPRDEFTETRFMEQMKSFLAKVFNETIIVDFKKR